MSRWRFWTERRSLHGWNRRQLHSRRTSPDIVRIPKLPEKTEWITVKHHYHRQKNDCSHIRNTRNTAGDTVSETANDQCRDIENDVEKNEEDENTWVSQDQVPYLFAGRPGIATLAIHYRDS